MKVTIKISTTIPKGRDRQPQTTAVVVCSEAPHFPPPRIVMAIKPRPGHQPDTVAATLLGIGDIEIDVGDDFFEHQDEATHPVILEAIRVAVAAKRHALAT